MKLPSIFQKNRDVEEPDYEPALADDGRLTNLALGASVRGLSNIYTPDAEPAAQSSVRDIADVLLELTRSMTSSIIVCVSCRNRIPAVIAHHGCCVKKSSSPMTSS